MRAFITYVVVRSKRDKSQTVFVQRKRAIKDIRDDDFVTGKIRSQCLPTLDPFCSWQAPVKLIGKRGRRCPAIDGTRLGSPRWKALKCKSKTVMVTMWTDSMLVFYGSSSEFVGKKCGDTQFSDIIRRFSIAVGNYLNKLINNNRLSILCHRRTPKSYIT